MAKKDKRAGRKDTREKDQETGGNKVLTILIALLIVIIWLAVFGALIKFDIGGFGSGVLRPILKDVPILNLILPEASDEQVAQENDYDYKSLPEAIARIKELEATIDEMSKSSSDNSSQAANLQAEVDRLKVFEDNQKAFEEKEKEFDQKVVFADNAPDIEEYKKYYEEINPTNAEFIYRQVVEQLQYSEAIKEKADIYKSMDPKAAAQILETMTADIESVAKILLSMSNQKSADIMAEMDSVMAAKITKKMLDMDEEKLAFN